MPVSGNRKNVKKNLLIYAHKDKNTGVRQDQ